MPQKQKGKKDNDKDRNKKGPGKLRRQAKRDIRVAYQPYLRDIQRQESEAKDTFQESNKRVGNIYDALQSELQGLGVKPDMRAISGELTSDLAGLTDLLGSSGPAGEQAAAAGLFGTIGAGGLQDLASQRGRLAGYNASTQRQGAVERAGLRRNYMEDYQDLLDSLKQQRLDYRQDMAPQILARIDELRQRKGEAKRLNAALNLDKSRFGFEKKQTRQQNRQENRSQKAGEEVIEDEQARRQIGRRLRRTNTRLGNVKEKIQGLPEGWDVIESMTGLPGDPELYEKGQKLQDRRESLQERRKRLRRRKRNV